MVWEQHFERGDEVGSESEQFCYLLVASVFSKSGAVHRGCRVSLRYMNALRARRVTKKER